MTRAEIKEAILKEFSFSEEERKARHPLFYDMGAEFVDYTDEGEMIMMYPIKPEQRNGYQLLQGGIITAFIDNNYGFFGYVSTNAASLPTIDISVNFHKGVLNDIDKIYVTSRVVSAGKRVLSMSAEARTEAGVLVASSKTNMLNAEGVRIHY